MELNVDPPVVNASGILSFLDVLAFLEKKGIYLGGFVTKSIGPEEKSGNENPVVYNTGDVFLNSLALPTQSCDDWVMEFEKFNFKKPIIASVFGYSPEEYACVIRKINEYVDAIEVNLGCPNRVPGEESLMEVVGKSTDMVKRAVAASRQATVKPIIAKLTPNADYMSIGKAALESGADWLGCANTVGPGISIDIWSGTPFLSGCSGGLSGPAIKPVNLKIVYDLYDEFRVPIIAYGGISKWQDVIEYFMAGASVVGLGTSLAYMDSDGLIKYTKNLWKKVQNFLGGRDYHEVIGAAHV